MMQSYNYYFGQCNFSDIFFKLLMSITSQSHNSLPKYTFSKENISPIAIVAQYEHLSAVEKNLPHLYNHNNLHLKILTPTINNCFTTVMILLQTLHIKKESSLEQTNKILKTTNKCNKTW